MARVFSIAPDAGFLALLAERILDGTLLGDWPREGPFWLSDVTVILPTKRARTELAEALSARGAGLLPDLRTFGGDGGEEEPFLPPFDAPPLPPPVGRLERRLTLARLIAAWAVTPAGAQAFASPPNPAEMLSLADSLAQLIDDLIIEGVPASALRSIDRDLPVNWQETLKFLDIALTAWPEILAAHGKAETATLRNLRLDRQAATAPLIYGDRPVIAAGSTGSIPATARLMAAIAGLKRGALVLPGLDADLDRTQFDALRNQRGTPHAHPQYGLVRFLERLGLTPADVIELAPGPRPARTLATRRAMALAEATSGWLAARQDLAEGLVEATDGLAILAARTADEEARAIALAARDGLARGRRVAVITPDRNLGRRIAAELGRFDILVDDPAGTPLFQSPAGRFARQALAVVASGCAPVDVMALLHNRALRLGLDRAELTRRAQLLDRLLLRGRRFPPGCPALHKALADLVADTALPAALRPGEDDAAALADLLARLEAGLAPLTRALAGETVSPAALAGALVDMLALCEGVDAAPPPGQAELLAWAEEARSHGADIALAAFEPDALLAALMAGYEVRNRQDRRQDILVLGPIEARLLNRDLVILAGLNDDIWPQPADPGPWLSRALRVDIGLEPPERDQGRAAHDFEMALGNPEVILAYAERIGTSPALPSRLVQRLEAFLGTGLAADLRARGNPWCEAARLLDAVPAVTPAPRPAPRPPAALRPRRLSITEIETLVRSPYDLYARHVLRLRQLAPLGEDPSLRERGSIIHDIFARFIAEGHDLAAPDAESRLVALAAEAFTALDAMPERRDIWLRRFALAARHFLDFERPRAVVARHAEIRGEVAIPTLGGFVLSGRADRIDRRADGAIEVLDFKTGTVPSAGQMTAFLAPQLPLTAALARAGGFAPDLAAPATALTYIKIGFGPDAFRPSDFRVEKGASLDEAVDETWRRMQAHVQALLLRDDLPMPARVLPQPRQAFRGPYDHLARIEEWTLTEADAE